MALGWPLVQCQLIISNLWCVSSAWTIKTESASLSPRYERR